MRKATLLDWLCAALLCVVPALVSLGLTQGYLHASLDQFRPRACDELDNWHQIATFVVAGVHGGHYGREDTAAPAAALGLGTFGPHGIGLNLVYGLPAKVFGWSVSSAPVYNLIALTAGLSIMVLTMRPGWRFSLKAALLLASCSYIYLYLPILTPEAALLGLCCAMAGLFYRLFQRSPGAGWTAAAWSLAGLIVTAALLRYYYALLVFGLLLFTEDPRTGRQWLAWAIKGSLMAGLLVAVYLFFAAPFPYDAFPGSLFGMKLYAQVLHGNVGALWRHLAQNVQITFFPDVYTAYHVFFLMTVAAAVAFPVMALHQAARESDENLRRRFLLLAGFQTINLLGGIFILLFYYYAMYGDFGTRMLTPSLFLSLLLSLRTIRGRWWYPFLALNLVLAPLMLRDYRSIMPPYFEEIPEDHESRAPMAAFAAHLRYDPTAANPWCNTLQTVGFFNFSWQLGVPAGIGVNETRFSPGGGTRDRPFRAGYVLLRSQDVLREFMGNASLRPLASGPDWMLFRNEAANCRDASGIP